jgi:hypothetical protein
MEKSNGEKKERDKRIKILIARWIARQKNKKKITLPAKEFPLFKG